MYMILRNILKLFIIAHILNFFNSFLCIFSCFARQFRSVSFLFFFFPCRCVNLVFDTQQKCLTAVLSFHHTYIAPSNVDFLLAFSHTPSPTYISIFFKQKYYVIILIRVAYNTPSFKVLNFPLRTFSI